MKTKILIILIVVIGLAITGILAWQYWWVPKAKENGVVETSPVSLWAESEVGPDPFNLALTEDGRLLYVSNTSSDDITVINTQTETVVDRIPIQVE